MNDNGQFNNQEINQNVNNTSNVMNNNSAQQTVSDNQVPIEQVVQQPADSIVSSQPASEQTTYQIPGVVIAPPTDNNTQVSTVQMEQTPVTSVQPSQQNTTTSTAGESTNTPNVNQNTIATPNAQSEVPKKKKNILAIIFFLIILGLGGYIFYSHITHQKEVTKLKEECTPVSTKGETKELDINSTIVQDLYSKVKTNIREDLANFDLNDEMKLYLAYRQIPSSKIYDSNCNYFNNTKMYAFTCEEKLTYTPTAFKEADLVIEFKKIFGENTVINHSDIQLANTCIGGYQYIAERGEYVEGECNELTTTTFKVDKELTKATSTESTIVLYEKVKYYGSEGKDYPEKLKSGTYKYTFKLDPNYNYIYVNREYEV